MNSGNGGSGTGIHGNVQRLIECLNRINGFTVYKKIAATNLTAVNLRNFVSPAVLICTKVTLLVLIMIIGETNCLLYRLISLLIFKGTERRGSHFITCLANEQRSSIIEHSTALLGFFFY